jgi:prepilin-type N-terminal cleavage/methylation domain-containing protein
MKALNVPKGQRGFTLIETTIALTLLMIIFSGVAPLCVYAMKYNSAAAIRAGALAVAQRKLEQLRASPFASCTSSSEAATTLSPYNVEITVIDTSPTLKNVRIVVTPKGKSTTNGVYGGKDGWMRGQVIIDTQRTTLGAGPNLG